MLDVSLPVRTLFLVTQDASTAAPASTAATAESASVPTAEDTVTIEHDGIDGTAVVTREAFELEYRRKGWVIVQDEPTPAEPVAAPVVDASATAAPARTSPARRTESTDAGTTPTP